MKRVVAFAALSLACSAGTEKDPAPGKLGDASDDGATFDVSGLEDVSVGDGDPQVIPDPETCAQAAAGRTYVGCDFWPTVTDNMVRPEFDFAVVVGNTGSVEADIEVTRGAMTIATAKVAPNALTKIYLPWVTPLKQILPNNGCGTNINLATVRANGGAYHLRSSVPVVAYQFNPIEYAMKGGPAGKDWSAICAKKCPVPAECFSFTNDASLLLPSTALTGNYRVAGVPSWPQSDTFTQPGYFVVTGTKDGTSVTVNLSSTAQIAGGGGLANTNPGGKVTFMLNAGDVVEVVGTANHDLSGSLVKASEPVQVITGIACTNMPHGTYSCDHVEESLLPVETLGKHYFVTVPTAPDGSLKGHVVRLFGNVDGTALTYGGAKPQNAPSTISAGEVVDLGVVKGDFELVADHELTVASVMIGAGDQTGGRQGDPSQSFSVTVEQFRLKYVFLGPDDYDSNWVDIVQPMDAVLTLDGAPLTQTPQEIANGYGVNRVKLGPGNGGAHVLTGTKPFGIQVLGYGAYTSYHYPGGLNLGRIAPLPIK